MEAATKLAIQGMADLLVDTLGIDDTDAAMLIACAADVRTGLAGNPPYTMRVAVPKTVLALCKILGITRVGRGRLYLRRGC